MFRYLIFLVLALAVAGTLTPALAKEIALTPGEGITVEGPDPTQIYTFDGISMRLQPNYPEGETEWIESVTLFIKSREHGSLSVTSTAGLTGFVGLGVYQLDSQGGPTILFDTYTGGAHCCTQINAIYLWGDEPVIADPGMFNGGYGIEDVDGDGRSEIIVSDDRFLYTFDAYAFSFSPMMILKSRGGEIYDATSHPAFRDLIEAEYFDFASLCLTDEGLNPSPCAAMLADAALLGDYEGARVDVATAIMVGTPIASGWGEYTFCVDTACDETVEYTDFLEAVERALTDWGYLKD